MLNAGIALGGLEHARPVLGRVEGLVRAVKPLIPSSAMSEKNGEATMEILTYPEVLELSLSTRGSILFNMSDLWGPAVFGAGPEPAVVVEEP